jgi:hypothetical protein
MSRVTRLDTTDSLAPPQRLASGFVRFDAFLARSGCLTYVLADGGTRTEYRPPEENRRAETLDSFALAPLTLDHPPGRRVDSTNAKRYSVGAVERPVMDGDRMRAKLLVTDAAAVAAIAAGKQQVSCGYSCELLEEPGTAPDGQRYDAVQRNVEGNHVAITDTARAGPSIRLRADSMDLDISEVSPTEVKKGAPTVALKKIRADHVEVEVPEALVAHVDSLLETIATATKALEGEKARADAAAAEVVKLKAEVASMPTRIAEAAKVRAELEGVAARAEVKADGLSTEALRAAIAAKVTGVKCDGVSPEYVAGLYSAAVAQWHQCTRPSHRYSAAGG